MIYILIFIFGTIIGSFLNVLSLRYNTGQSAVFRHSHCFSCGKRLSWPELIPIFSFIIQKGRCRRCKSKISWQYPIVESVTGLIFISIFYKIFNFQFSIFNEFSITNYQFLSNLALVAYYWLIFSLLIVISVYDIRHQIIPNGLVYAFIIFSLFSVFFETPTLLVGAPTLLGVGVGNLSLLSRFLSGLSIGGLFGALWLVSKGRWMGFGDAKLALGIGWFLGLQGIMAVLFSFWAGALVGVFLLLFHVKNLTIKSRIPFGPFLVFGALFVFLFGNEILNFLPLY